MALVSLFKRTIVPTYSDFDKYSDKDNSYKFLSEYLCEHPNKNIKILSVYKHEFFENDEIAVIIDDGTGHYHTLCFGGNRNEREYMEEYIAFMLYNFDQPQGLLSKLENDSCINLYFLYLNKNGKEIFNKILVCDKCIVSLSDTIIRRLFYEKFLQIKKKDEERLILLLNKLISINERKLTNF